MSSATTISPRPGILQTLRWGRDAGGMGSDVPNSCGLRLCVRLVVEAVAGAYFIAPMTDLVFVPECKAPGATRRHRALTKPVIGVSRANFSQALTTLLSCGMRVQIGVGGGSVFGFAVSGARDACSSDGSGGSAPRSESGTLGLRLAYERSWIPQRR
jgi:hypothetical protein